MYSPGACHLTCSTCVRLCSLMCTACLLCIPLVYTCQAWTTCATAEHDCSSSLSQRFGVVFLGNTVHVVPRYEASYSSSLHHDQEPSLASHQSSGGINPWAASEQSSMLDSNSRSSRSILGSVHGSRSRNSSAVLDELVRQRSCGEYYLPSATSTSM